ncbi:MAG: carboxymuconolactone decarboxylase family protein [Ilumatobacteraceae bacterium]
MRTLHEAMATRPELAEPLDDYLASAFAAVDPVVLELCRLRIATLHGDANQQRLRTDAAIVAGLDEDKIAALADHHRASQFTDHERACLAYAEQFVIDVHGLTDADADRVKDGMTDAEFVAFTVALGLLDGVGRMRLVLDLEA